MNDVDALNKAKRGFINALIQFGAMTGVDTEHTEGLIDDEVSHLINSIPEESK